MPLAITLVAATDAASGPFPPNYPAGAVGFVAAASNPAASSAGSATPSTYFGATVVAIANDVTAATEFLFALLGSFDQTFIGNITTPDGKVYNPTQAVYLQTLVGTNTITSWTWPLAAGGSHLVSGTVTVADSEDVLINLVGVAKSSTEIDLTWTNSVSGGAPTNYLLYRGIAGATPTLYQTLSGATLAYADTGLTASQEYTYAVTATYADGTDAGSASLSLFTPASGVAAAFNCNCASNVPDNWTVDTLGNLRKRVLINSGYAAQAANPPPGMKDLVNEKLATAQKQLYRQHSEFRIKRMFAWQMQIDQRYYGFSNDEGNCGVPVDPLSIEWVGFEDLNQAWYQLTGGIDPLLYTRAQISTGWPTHYEIRACIEIFPAPKANYTLWIKARAGISSFVNDSDFTTVDSESICLLATGMLKAHYNQADANSVLTQAMNYTKYLVAGQHGTKRFVPRTRVQTPWTPPVFLPLKGQS